eukprot:scaffold275134_cov28-Tisochrysis_lutea.AAC.3
MIAVCVCQRHQHQQHAHQGVHGQVRCGQVLRVVVTVLVSLSLPRHPKKLLMPYEGPATYARPTCLKPWPPSSVDPFLVSAIVSCLRPPDALELDKPRFGGYRALRGISRARFDADPDVLAQGADHEHKRGEQRNTTDADKNAGGADEHVVEHAIEEDDDGSPHASRAHVKRGEGEVRNPATMPLPELVKSLDAPGQLERGLDGRHVVRTILVDAFLLALSPPVGTDACDAAVYTATTIGREALRAGGASRRIFGVKGKRTGRVRAQPRPSTARRAACAISITATDGGAGMPQVKGARCFRNARRSDGSARRGVGALPPEVGVRRSLAPRCCRGKRAGGSCAAPGRAAGKQWLHVVVARTTPTQL